jgi:outer membrane protein assembly factor BamB
VTYEVGQPGNAVTLIDLGDDFAPADDSPITRVRGRRGRSRNAFFLVLIFVLVVAAAAAGPVRPAVRQILTLPGSTADSLQLYDDSLYVWDNRQPVSKTQVTAYDLDGNRRWRRVLPGSGPDSNVLETNNETIVDANFVDGDAHLLGLDKRTGALLWDQVATFGNGYPYIAMVDPRGRMLVYEAGRSTSRMEWLDTRTGKPLWTEELTGSWSPDFLREFQPGQRMWVVSRTGELVGLRLADHEDRVSHMLSGLAPGTSVYDRSITADDATILVTDVFGTFPYHQNAVVHAFDVGTLAPRWSSELSDNGGATLCGSHVCEMTNAGVTVVDLANGAHLWTAHSEVAYPIGNDLVVGPYSAPGAGPQRLVDGATGRVIADLSAWNITPAGPSSLLLVQPTRGYLGVWLAKLDAGAVQPTVLLAATGMSTRCEATAQVIACRAIDGTMTVWRTN